MKQKIIHLFILYRRNKKKFPSLYPGKPSDGSRKGNMNGSIRLEGIIKQTTETIDKN